MTAGRAAAARCAGARCSTAGPGVAPPASARRRCAARPTAPRVPGSRSSSRRAGATGGAGPEDAPPHPAVHSPRSADASPHHVHLPPRPARPKSRPSSMTSTTGRLSDRCIDSPGFMPCCWSGEVSLAGCADAAGVVAPEDRNTQPMVDDGVCGDRRPHGDAPLPPFDVVRGTRDQHASPVVTQRRRVAPDAPWIGVVDQE